MSIPKWIPSYSLQFLLGFIMLSNISCKKEIIDYDLQNGKWILTQMEFEDILYKPSNEVNITFTIERISGFGGCNNYSGKYKLFEDSIKITSLFSTYIYCGENDIMMIENNFLLNLHTSFTLKITGNKLWIYSKNGELEFINEN